MITKTTTFLTLLLSLGLVTVLAGCVNPRPVTQYTLTTDSALQPVRRQIAPMTILVGPVKVASYLDQPRMIRRHGATRIDSISSHQWAGDLDEMIGNKLVAEMGVLLKPSPLFPYPGTTVFTQGRRVAIDILRFEGADDRDAVVEARWTLFDLKDKTIMKTQSSLYRVPLGDDSHEALATALSQGLTRLGQEIAASIMP